MTAFLLFSVLHPFSPFSMQTLDRFCVGCPCQVVSLLKLSQCLFSSPWSNSHSSENESHCVCHRLLFSQCWRLHPSTTTILLFSGLILHIYSHRPLFQECSSLSHSIAWPSHPSTSQPHFPLSIKGVIYLSSMFPFFFLHCGFLCGPYNSTFFHSEYIPQLVYAGTVSLFFLWMKTRALSHC